jgi:hypothetical protein
MVAKTYAVVVGVVSILLGVAGLLLGDGRLLGLVNVGVVEDLVHVASGVCCSLRVYSETQAWPAT